MNIQAEKKQQIQILSIAINDLRAELNDFETLYHAPRGSRIKGQDIYQLGHVIALQVLGKLRCEEYRRRVEDFEAVLDFGKAAAALQGGAA